jgi:hypothetical protein
MRLKVLKKRSRKNIIWVDTVTDIRGINTPEVGEKLKIQKNSNDKKRRNKIT